VLITQTVQVPVTQCVAQSHVENYAININVWNYKFSVQNYTEQLLTFHNVEQPLRVAGCTMQEQVLNVTVGVPMTRPVVQKDMVQVCQPAPQTQKVTVPVPQVRRSTAAMDVSVVLATASLVMGMNRDMMQPAIGGVGLSSRPGVASSNMLGGGVWMVDTDGGAIRGPTPWTPVSANAWLAVVAALSRLRGPPRRTGAANCHRLMWWFGALTPIYCAHF
jgi:hypothetical protein